MDSLHFGDPFLTKLLNFTSASARSAGSTYTLRYLSYGTAARPRPRTRGCRCISPKSAGVAWIPPTASRRAPTTCASRSGVATATRPPPRERSTWAAAARRSKSTCAWNPRPAKNGSLLRFESEIGRRGGPRDGSLVFREAQTLLCLRRRGDGRRAQRTGAEGGRRWPEAADGPCVGCPPGEPAYE